MDQAAIEAQLQLLKRPALTGYVRQALNNDTAEILDWHYQKHQSGDGGGAIYHISGIARQDQHTVGWTLILKILSPAMTGSGARAAQPGYLYYWKREALLYRSGLFDALPHGIAAPRCFGVDEHVDGSLWLWLEEVAGRHAGPWDGGESACVARCLGRFNGAYLVERPIPDLPYLSRQLVADWLDRFAPERSFAQDRTIWDTPVLQRHFSPSLVDRLLKLYADLPRYSAMLERVPHTFCHHDAHRPNIFLCDGQDAGLVLIDWAYAGLGVVGADAGLLFATSRYIHMHTLPIDLHDLDTLIFESYLAGLRDAGWQGTRNDARTGYIVTAVIRIAAQPSLLQFAVKDEQQRDLERWTGRSVDDLYESYAVLLAYLLDLADEAVALSATR